MTIDPRIRDQFAGSPFIDRVLTAALAEVLAAAPPVVAVAHVRAHRLDVAKAFGRHLADVLPDDWSASRAAAMALALADALTDRLEVLAAQQADPTGAPN